MKSPAGMRAQSAIQADIDQWVADNTGNTESGGSICCNKCNTVIQATTLYASVHESGWSNCAGFGEVKKLPLPYCPACEPDVPKNDQRTCIHEEAA